MKGENHVKVHQGGTNFRVHGFINGELLGGPIENLFDFVLKNGSAPEITTRLDILAITSRQPWCVSIWKMMRSVPTTTTT